jgi:hypothetical protein
VATFRDKSIHTLNGGMTQQYAFKVKVGISCMNIMRNLEWGNWIDHDSFIPICPINTDIGIFETGCSSGIPIGCISQTKGGSDYDEDFLQSVFIESGKCKVYADDFDLGSPIASCEQNRRIGAICYSQ